MTGFCFSGEPTQDHESAVVRAFFNDRLYFKFKGDQFFPLTVEQVIEIENRKKKEEEMGIKNLSKDALLVELPSKSPKIANQLKAVNGTVSKNGTCNVIIDFHRVEIINSANISNLLILHNMVQNSGHRLIFCNVATVTKCIFVVAVLNDIFEFVDDRSKAMATVEQAV